MGTYSQGDGISNNGQVVGESFTKDNVARRAFVHNGAVISDIGSLGGVSIANSTGLAINDNGEIAGNSDMLGDTSAHPVQHAFLYSGGVMRDLGTFGGSLSFGLGINSRGDVVGGAGTAAPFAGDQHAFLYRGNSLLDLGTLGGTYSFGTAVNTNAQVSGYSVTSGKLSTRAFIYSGNALLDLGTLPLANVICGQACPQSRPQGILLRPQRAASQAHR